MSSMLLSGPVTGGRVVQIGQIPPELFLGAAGLSPPITEGLLAVKGSCLIFKEKFSCHSWAGKRLSEELTKNYIVL